MAQAKTATRTATKTTKKRTNPRHRKIEVSPISREPALPRYRNFDGEPIETPEAEKLLKDINARQLAVDVIPSGDGGPKICLVTRFTVCDPWESNPPMLWETVIVGGPHSGVVAHYASREEAANGHSRTLNSLLFDEPPNPAFEILPAQRDEAGWPDSPDETLDETFVTSEASEDSTAEEAYSAEETSRSLHPEVCAG